MEISFKILKTSYLYDDVSVVLYIQKMCLYFIHSEVAFVYAELKYMYIAWNMMKIHS